MFTESQRAIQVLTEAMHPEGFNIGINQGRAAGASAEHPHQHVVPRWARRHQFHARRRGRQGAARRPRDHRATLARGLQTARPAIVLAQMGSVIKKRRKKMRKHKHKKMLKKTRWARRG